MSYRYVMTTKHLLRNRIRARERKRMKITDVTLKKGAVLKEVANLGLSHTDGVHSVLNGDPVVMNVGTSTPDGRYRLIAIAVASGETHGVVKGILDAIDAGVREHFPSETGTAEWHMSDDGSAMKTGIEAHMDARGSVEELASCWGRLDTKIISSNKNRLKQKKIIFEKVLPAWSESEMDWGTVTEIKYSLSVKEQREAAAFSKDKGLISVSPHVYCCRQKTRDGDLHKLEQETVNQALALWKKKKWTHKDLKLVSSVRFITPETCFPFHDFARHEWCYHCVGVQLLESDSSH